MCVDGISVSMLLRKLMLVCRIGVRVSFLLVIFGVCIGVIGVLILISFSGRLCVIL